ncbi:MAG: DUF1214 domain-containing protein [Hyphomonas sp.]|uniref:DUF1214 domain-containing protein n=1 Tax=Hyphomonas sp. TaxID=87 RepID=UPI0034A06048
MKIISGLVGLLLGAALGLGSALAAAGIIGPGMKFGGAVDVSGWVSDWTIGSEAANPWTRARVARHGLLALTKDEAVYFTRNTDQAGDRLIEDCTYRVSGGEMPALWWSVTLYDATSYLPANKDRALSFDQTKAGLGDGGDSWSFIVSATGPETGSWVSSQEAGNFDLTLRLYKPTPELIADPEGVLASPAIEKLACGGPA